MRRKKIATILLKTFFNVFSLKKKRCIFEYTSHQGLFLQQGVAPNRRKAITWTNYDPVVAYVYQASICESGIGGMDKQFHPTFYCAYDYSSMLDFMLKYVSKRVPDHGVRS